MHSLSKVICKFSYKGKIIDAAFLVDAIFNLTLLLWCKCVSLFNPFSSGTYIPRKEVVVEETIRATVIKPNQSIKLRARKETTDRDGNPRVTGEEWLVTKVGAYLPGAYEEVVDVVDAYVLTEKVCVCCVDECKKQSVWYVFAEEAQSKVSVES